MADLSIDYEELGHSRSKVENAASTFRRADRVSQDISGMVGHPGLASKVGEFATSWDINRAKLQDSLEFIAESLKSVADTFAEVDAAQAKSLSGHKKTK